MHLFFCEHLHAILRRPSVFSRALGCGARRGPACTRRRRRSRPGSVAHALGVHSRRNLASDRGIAFRPAGDNQAHANIQNVILFIFTALCCCFPSTTAASRLRLPRYKSRASSLCSFVTATYGVSACGFVSLHVCACVIAGSYSSRKHRNSLQNRGVVELLLVCHFRCAVCCCMPVSHSKLLMPWQPRYNSSRASRSSFCDSYIRTVLLCVRVCVLCERAILLNTTRDNLPTHPLPLKFKSIRAVNQRYNSSSSCTMVNLATPIYTGTPVFRLFQLARFQVKHIPHGYLELIILEKKYFPVFPIAAVRAYLQPVSFLNSLEW